MTNPQDNGNPSARQALSKRTRFEVFKRDKFACIYCGATAAQKLLHCDHVKPVVEGGETTLLNLVTACADCNLGKGARPLSDDSAMATQHRQLAELEERRQQLELMRQWREELEAHTVTEVDIVADEIGARTPWVPNENGRNDLRRMIKKNGLPEVLEAASQSFDMYFRDGSETDWNQAFKKIGLVISMREQAKDDPDLPKLLYIQGILRNRLHTRDDYVAALRAGRARGLTLERMQREAKRASGWDSYAGFLNPPAPEPKPPQVDDVDDHEEDPEITESIAAWDDPGWHIRMWSRCFRDTAAGCLFNLAGESQWGGAVDGGKITRDDLRLLRGLRAVGLIVPLNSTKNDDICRYDDRGSLLWSFRILPLSPRDATNAFNRFGALRMGFWHNPNLFAPVSAVH